MLSRLLRLRKGPDAMLSPSYLSFCAFCSMAFAMRRLCRVTSCMGSWAFSIDCSQDGACQRFGLGFDACIAQGSPQLCWMQQLHDDVVTRNAVEGFTVPESCFHISHGDHVAPRASLMPLP